MTIARGRHQHLRGQGWGLLHQTRRPDLYVAVAMGDRAVAGLVREQHPDAVVVDVSVTGDDLPLSAARNAGARVALQAGAEVLVFFDVDCIPAPTTVARYSDVLATTDHANPVVACGEVRYLPPVDDPREYRTPGLANRAEPHPARPAPAPGAVERADDVRLFWSLSFAVTASDWLALGGFDEMYVGYGAEDTDFGQRIAAADGTMLWVGGAAAYHQHHPTQTPPVSHLRSIVRNANVFRERWGWFPMQGWLSDFAAHGLAEHDASTDRWRVTA